MSTKTQNGKPTSDYRSNAAVKRGMRAAKDGRPEDEVDAAMEHRDVTAEEFFSHPKQEAPKKIVGIKAIEIQSMKLRIVGDTGLITHKWSEKAMKKMRDKHAKQAQAKGRDVRDPHQEYLDAIYLRKDGSYGFPAIAFKKAAVQACSSLKGYLTQVEAKQAFHVTGPEGDTLVQIEGEPVMREDAVTVGIDSADLRYRPEFVQWETTLHIRFNAAVMSAEQIVNLFNVAGFAVGVGEWRNERNGLNGAFHVKTGA